MSEELNPCPFCGGKAHIERAGTHRQSTIYECGSCGCRLETGEEFNYGGRWNERDDKELTDLRARCEKAEKDAERYRFYRSKIVPMLDGGPTEDDFDADLDEAINRKKS